MSYVIDIEGLPTIRLSEEQYRGLEGAVTLYANNGFRDGWAKFRNVRITECGERDAKKQD